MHKILNVFEGIMYYVDSVAIIENKTKDKRKWEITKQNIDSCDYSFGKSMSKLHIWCYVTLKNNYKNNKVILDIQSASTHS